MSQTQDPDQKPRTFLPNFRDDHHPRPQRIEKTPHPTCNGGMFELFIALYCLTNVFLECSEASQRARHGESDVSQRVRTTSPSSSLETICLTQARIRARKSFRL